jgi:hypothetical protein
LCVGGIISFGPFLMLSDNSGDATTNIPFLYYTDVVGRTTTQFGGPDK